ncbi:MAG: glycosyltransferase family 2 protein [Thermodesulfovibrionales bacterium]|nr:glycosyltransferase family 2 protein [Thermodesulfovibrionales bacterium]
MVSAIIVNYRTSDTIAKAVNSVLSEGGVEVIVVDNTAEDTERERLKKIIPAQAKTIFNNENVGFGRACNMAYTKASGEYILLLNPDAYLLQGSLQRLKKVLTDIPVAGAVGPKVFWDDSCQFLLPPSYLTNPIKELIIALKGSCKLYSLYWRARAVKIWQSPTILEVKALSGGHVLIKRDAIEKAGGLFDEDFFMFYEDSELMMRLRNRGFKLYYVPDAWVVHNHCIRNSKMKLAEKYKQVFYEKCFSNSLLHEFSEKIPSFLKQDFDPTSFREVSIKNNSLTIQIPDVFDGVPWLFELSPNPLFLPAVGFFGQGRVLEITETILRFLDTGRYYCRVSNPQRFFSKMHLFFFDITC